jgi:hypothetical protein
VVRVHEVFRARCASKGQNMAAKKKVDGRTKEARALKARRKASLKDDPKPKRGGRPVGGRLPKLGDVVRITKGAEKHALGTIGNEDGKHWIVFEDRSNVGIRVRKTSVRLATLDERHIHNRKLVAIDVALTTFQNGDYERDDVPKQDEAEEVEDLEWENGVLPPSIAAEWGLTPGENKELCSLLVAEHEKHGGEAYDVEPSFTLSTGKLVAFKMSAEAGGPESTAFAYAPLSVVAVGGGESDVEEEEDEDGEDEGEQLTLPLNIVDGRDTAAAQSLLGD